MIDQNIAINNEVLTVSLGYGTIGIIYDKSLYKADQNRLIEEYITLNYIGLLNKIIENINNK